MGAKCQADSIGRSMYLDNSMPTAKVYTRREKYRQDHIMTESRYRAYQRGRKRRGGQKGSQGRKVYGVWLTKIFMNGGDIHRQSE